MDVSDALAHCAKIYVDKIESLSCTVRVFVVVARNSREGRKARKKKKEKYRAPFLCPLNRRGKKSLKSPQHFHLFPEAWGI